MKSVTCVCGAEFKSQDDKELVAIVQAHAKEHHQHDLAAEQILKGAVELKTGSK